MRALLLVMSAVMAIAALWIRFAAPRSAWEKPHVCYCHPDRNRRALARYNLAVASRTIVDASAILFAAFPALDGIRRALRRSAKSSMATALCTEDARLWELLPNDQLLALCRSDPSRHVRIGCLDALRGRGGARELCEELLHDEDTLIRLSAARHLSGSSRDAVLRELARDADASLAAEATSLLDDVPFLLARLDDGPVIVRLAAANALARCGDLRAVEHLLPLTRELLGDEDLVTAARWAIDAIRGRAPGAAGQLSVSAPAGDGALSEANGHGCLNFPREGE